MRTSDTQNLSAASVSIVTASWSVLELDGESALDRYRAAGMRAVGENCGERTDTGVDFLTTARAPLG